MIEFALLGALTAHGPTGPCRSGHPSSVGRLVRLLLGRNQVVATRDLIDDLWPDRPPSSATANLRMYVANLRRSFAAADAGAPPRLVDIARLPSGYRLTADDNAIDVDRFDAGATRGQAALTRGDSRAAVGEYTAALSLWRGRSSRISRTARTSPRTPRRSGIDA